MAAMTPLAHQLRWYIAIRVVAIVSVLLPFGLFQLWLPAAQPQPGLVGPPVPPLAPFRAGRPAPPPPAGRGGPAGPRRPGPGPGAAPRARGPAAQRHVA